jgi:hypothetical protein
VQATTPSQYLKAASASLEEVEGMLLHPNPRRLEALGDRLTRAMQLLGTAELGLKGAEGDEREACLQRTTEVRARLGRIHKLMEQLSRFSEQWGQVIQSELGYGSGGQIVELSRSWQSTSIPRSTWEG